MRACRKAHPHTPIGDGLRHGREDILGEPEARFRIGNVASDELAQFPETVLDRVFAGRADTLDGLKL